MVKEYIDSAITVQLLNKEHAGIGILSSDLHMEAVQINGQLDDLIVQRLS